MRARALPSSPDRPTTAANDGDACGNTSNTKPERDFEGKPERDRPGSRPCLCCGKPFSSDGWHNRLCSGCKGRG